MNLRLFTENRFRCLGVEGARSILRIFKQKRFLPAKKGREGLVRKGETLHRKGMPPFLTLIWAFVMKHNFYSLHFVISS